MLLHTETNIGNTLFYSVLVAYMYM